jgi:hypothetical protein
VHHTGQTGVGLDRQHYGFRASTDDRFGSGGRGSGGWSGKFVGGQFARRSLPRAQYGDGKSRSFEMERRDGPQYFFRGFCSPPGREDWFPHSGYVVVFVEVALVGEMLWIVLTPLWSKWLGTGFFLLVLTPELSR